MKVPKSQKTYPEPIVYSYKPPAKGAGEGFPPHGMIEGEQKPKRECSVASVFG